MQKVKIILIVFSLFMSSNASLVYASFIPSVSSKSQSFAITSPYQPNFLKRNKNAFNILKAASLGMLTYFGASRFHQINPVYSALTLFLFSLFYDEFIKKDDQLDLLLNKPSRALNNNHQTVRKFKNIGTKLGLHDASEWTIDEYSKRYLSLVHEFEQENPIFQLNECMTEDWGLCSLSRKANPNHRQYFEKEIIELLHSKLQEKGEVNYVSFGCGGMFQDLVIITKLLAAKPSSQITIHFIDLSFQVYQSCRDLLQNSRRVSDSYTVDPKLVIEKLRNLAIDVGGLDANDKELDKNLILECITCESRVKEFISFLSQRFPLAKIKLYVHGNVDQYITYIKDNQFSFADVISAIDIEDEMSLIRGSVKSYYELCTKTLKHNSTSKNILCGKVPYTAKASISYLGLSPLNIDGESKVEFDFEGQSITVYHRSKELV